MDELTQDRSSRDRDRMVERQLARRGVRDEAVLAAMRRIPREAFVDPGYEESAYDDGPLPIGEGQTISQPYIVARMIEAAEVRPGDRVLEVGAGSGYAAAVLGAIAREVHAIERHPSLARAAERRLGEAGLGNVTIHTGDGTRGLAEAAPFDAILVAAGAPTVPDALKRQLAPGGRLVMPVGDAGAVQTLTKFTRRGADAWEEESLGGVRFVPLIGEPEATDDKPGLAVAREPTLSEMIAAAAEPLPDLDDPGLGALFDRFAAARVVLLGESSHGTSEFYRARAAITRRLVAHHGFTIVAVEADWPDAAAVHRFIRGRPPREGAEPPFRRFPTWMWRNAEVAELADWLRVHNESAAAPAGFYGLDLYNMRASIAAVLSYLEAVDPEAARLARERYGCLTPWQQDPAAYGRSMLSAGFRTCEQAVVEACRNLLERELSYAAADGESFLDAAQNARLIASAERYYRSAYYGGPESWNLRDTHMFETLEHLLEAHGRQSKAIVWAHNSHIGDARHTAMGAARDEINIGQLCRARFGDDAALIGFGTDSGTVAAATDWDGEMEIKRVRPALEGSYEWLCMKSGAGRFLLDLRPDGGMRRSLLEPRLERFIGVIYRPETERASHYMEAVLPRQFDAYVWFDRTEAVTPVGAGRARGADPETYPFGL